MRGKRQKVRGRNDHPHNMKSFLIFGSLSGFHRYNLWSWSGRTSAAWSEPQYMRTKSRSGVWDFF